MKIEEIYWLYQIQDKKKIQTDFGMVELEVYKHKISKIKIGYDNSESFLRIHNAVPGCWESFDATHLYADPRSIFSLGGILKFQLRGETILHCLAPDGGVRKEGEHFILPCRIGNLVCHEDDPYSVWIQFHDCTNCADIVVGMGYGEFEPKLKIEGLNLTTDKYHAGRLKQLHEIVE